MAVEKGLCSFRISHDLRRDFGGGIDDDALGEPDICIDALSQRCDESVLLIRDVLLEAILKEIKKQVTTRAQHKGYQQKDH